MPLFLHLSGTTDVYEFRREYKSGEQLAPNEVRLNGERVGYEGIEYGIENFFIPEGRGEIMNKMPSLRK